MATASQILSENAKLLKQKASKYSILGVLIAALAVIFATCISAYFNNGNSLSLAAVVNAQASNPGIVDTGLAAVLLCLLGAVHQLHDGL